MGKLKFNPADPASVEAAVLAMEAMVDAKAGPYVSDPIIGPFRAKSREAFAAAIRAKSNESRS